MLPNAVRVTRFEIEEHWWCVRLSPKYNLTRRRIETNSPCWDCAPRVCLSLNFHRKKWPEPWKIKSNPKWPKTQQKFSQAPATNNGIFWHKSLYKNDVFLARMFFLIFGASESSDRVRLRPDRARPSPERFRDGFGYAWIGFGQAQKGVGQAQKGFGQASFRDWQKTLFSSTKIAPEQTTLFS